MGQGWVSTGYMPPALMSISHSRVRHHGNSALSKVGGDPSGFRNTISGGLGCPPADGEPMRANPGKKHIITAGILFLAAVTGPAAGQPEPPALNPVLQALPITSALYDLAMEPGGEKAAGDVFVERMKARGMAGTPDGMVNVEILPREGDIPVASGFVEAQGGFVAAVWRGQTSAWIRPEKAIALAESLPPGYLLRHASLAWDNNEGPVTVGTDSYLAPGPAGQGISVGIIDRNFVGLTAAETSGDAPVATRHDYRTGNFEDGSSVHGVAHLETVFDHAPDADYHLFRIGNSTDLGTAVDDAIDAGINVLSATQSFYNQGWADNTGAAALAAKKAADNGILYVSSAGNRGTSHWQGPFDAYQSGTWLDWDPGPGEDFGNDLGSVGNSRSLHLYLQWDTDAGAADYNLYLYDTAGVLQAASVSGGTTFEDISWTNNSDSFMSVYVSVILNSGPAVDLELFENLGRPFEHQTPAGSLTSPNNNTAPNCLVIGAVPFDNYTDGNLYPYSSRGPTNSGARGIDLIGPTDTYTLAYDGEFGGTSCATPNVAGAAVALWSSVPQFNADGVRILLTNLALAYNDWGSGGLDYQYGYGGIQVPVFVDGTQWVDPRAANQPMSPALPWYGLPEAITASTGSRVLLLGGWTYLDPIVLDQPTVIGGVVDDSVVGGSQ